MTNVKDSAPSGRDIAKLVYDWAIKKRKHPDDIIDLFVHELLDEMEEDA